jgi:hypothetical protein
MCYLIKMKNNVASSAITRIQAVSADPGPKQRIRAFCILVQYC